MSCVSLADSGRVLGAGPHTSVPPHPVHLSSGGRHVNPSPSNALRSAVSISGAPSPAGPFSRSTHIPSDLRRTPLLSNLSPFTFLQYRRRSRWNVVPPLQPKSAHPTVFHGLMMMSTRRCGAPSWLGSCHTTIALSRVSKPDPLAPSPFHDTGRCPRSLLWSDITRLCVIN